jgi:hypothetical protein
MARSSRKNKSMDPNILKFIYVDSLVVLLVVAYLIFGRSKKSPSRLNLRESGGSDKSDVRELNVIFQFNGHDFDAYEALGVPAGTAVDKVEKIFEQTLKTAPPDSHHFLKMAYEAIRKSR